MPGNVPALGPRRFGSSGVKRNHATLFAILVLLLAVAGCATLPPLHGAARQGQAEKVRELLGKTNIDSIDPESGATALHHAASQGHIEVVRLLIERGANVNSKQRMFGYSPLNSASTGEVVRLLLENGADIEYAERQFEAAARAFPSVASQLRESSARLRLIADEMAPKIAAAKARRAMREKKQAAEVALGSKVSSIEAAEKSGDDAGKAGRLQEALSRYTHALKETPGGTEPDQRLREKIIALALAMDPPPAVPEEAVRHANRGQAFIRRAKDKQEFGLAASEFEQAVTSAPWWAVGYFNLGLVQEKVDDFEGAIRSLKLYLRAAPKAKDAGAVKKKLDDLEVAKELAEGKGR